MQPCPRKVRISSTSTAGSITIPSPSTQVTPLLSTPDGMRRVTYFLPSTTSVWPALAPPAQRTTKRAFSVSRSTIFPFPSSPHCTPTTITTAMIVWSSLKVKPGVSSATATASTSTAKPTAGLGRP